jgi:hypothetical protein
MNEQQAYQKGSRCGYIEGRHRAGSYVIGEEYELSWESADNQGFLSQILVTAWARGYRKGYLLAAEGSELPKECQC